MNILEYIGRPQFSALEAFFGAMAGRSALERDWWAVLVFIVGGAVLERVCDRYTERKS